MAKIGEDAIAKMAKLGLEELRAANSGQMAMDAPPVEVPATPPKPTYEEALDKIASMSEGQGHTQDKGHSR